jgi:putative ABC transport system permease protein
VIGPATIVSLVAATQGYTNAATARFSSLGATTISVSPVGRGVTLTAADVSTIQSLPGVSYVLPYYQISGQLTQGGETVGVEVIATNLTALSSVLPTLSLSQGSAPVPTDQVGAAIGYSVANPDIQGATNLTVGQVLTVDNVGRSSFGIGSFGGGVFFSAGSAGFGSSSSSSSATQRSFVITGIYSKFGQGLVIDPDTSVFVPLSAGQLILHSEDYSGLMVVASSASVVTPVITEITDTYGQDLSATSVSSLISSIQSVTQGTTTLLEAVAATSVLVAFTGIMTTMLTSVMERTKEIGILKALGTNSRGILFAFLAEASLTGLIGGIIGAAAGVGLSFVVISLLSRSTLGLGAGAGPTFARTGASAFARGGAAAASAASSASSTTLTITPAITPELIVLALVLAVSVGTLGGLLPAWRASRLNPVEALKRS